MRHDLYARIHKALRAMMADTLVAIGRMDPDDDCEVRDAVARLEELLVFCTKHAAMENEFVHRAIEGRRVDASCALALDHHDLEAEIDELRAIARREPSRLYRRVAAFVAANLVHMEREEGEGNALLHELFTDAEIAAIEARLVASIDPGFKMQGLRWMIPAVHHSERVEMFEAMRDAPPAAREGALAIARSHLKGRDLERLEEALAQREPATLES